MVDVPRQRSAGWLALAGSLLLWLAQPPVGWWWLGWLAPLPWLALVSCPSLPSRRPGSWLGYRDIWFASSVFWLVYLQGVRKAHPALYLGWIALALYLAVYLPVFLALARFAVHRLRWPLVIAAPVVWVAFELIRGRLLSGFTGGMLAHTQSPAVLVIQIVDTGGAYLLSGLIMATAACAWESIRSLQAARATTESLTPNARRRAIAYGLATLAIPGLMLSYGAWRLAQSPNNDSNNDSPHLRIALIQESIDTIFEFNPQRNVDAFERYLKRSVEACGSEEPLAAVVWPESMFTENSPEFLFEQREGLPRELQARQIAFRRKAQFAVAMLREAHERRHGANSPPPVLIAGTVTVEFEGDSTREYNSALLFDQEGQVADRYYKRHLVMFGEYIPLGKWFPVIYQLVGMPGDLREGEEERAFVVQDWRLAPSICFESLVPHHMGGKLRELERQGEPADVQVNLTNDGWFWGSSLLDMHLQAGVFRAAELRRPFVVAANTGVSAWVDGDGRVRGRAPKQQGATVVAELARDRRWSLYQQVGDWPLWLLVIGAALVATRRHLASRDDRPHRVPIPHSDLATE